MNSQEIEQSLVLAEHYFRNNNYKFAEEVLKKITKIDELNPKANELLAYIYENEGKSEDAYKHLTLASNHSKCSVEALYYLSIIQIKNKSYSTAISNLKKCLNQAGDFFEGLYQLGVAHAFLEKKSEALFFFTKSWEINKNSHECLFNIARCHDAMEQHHLALSAYDKSINLYPHYPEAWCNKGVALHQLKQYEQAIESYNKAIELKPNYAEAWSNKGITLHQLKQYEEALDCHKKTLKIDPNLPEAWVNQGNLLHDLKNYREAIDSYLVAIRINPKYAEAFSNLGLSLQKLGQYDDALKNYDIAISLKASFAEAWANKGNLLNQIKCYPEALTHYQKALEINPSLSYVFGDLLHLQMKICKWDNLEDAIKFCEQKILSSKEIIQPFQLLSLVDNPHLQKKCSEIFIKNQYSCNFFFKKDTRKTQDKKIKIAYFSPDLRNHPVARLIVQHLELHNKNKFEIYAFSFGADDKSELRNRITKCVDHFIDVTDLSEKAIAELSNELEIDIAIDLNGFTEGCRPLIFANRAAPIQINYLGYLGTMGANYIDYIIADKTIIEDEDISFYSEKILRIPSYQPNDQNRKTADNFIAKEDLGISKDSFVFCCFNNNYKILPGIIDLWASILKSIDNSILFLYADNKWAQENLTNEFSNRGINPNKLIFGERLNFDQYLARYKMCDLFLDTFPYNAGTTASDALWAGIPVLTLRGKSFSSRVGSSILKSANLDELIALTPQEYLNKAIYFAQNTTELNQIKHKLKQNKLSCALFDTKQFTDKLELAFEKIMSIQYSDKTLSNIEIT